MLGAEAVLRSLDQLTTLAVAKQLARSTAAESPYARFCTFADDATGNDSDVASVSNVTTKLARPGLRRNRRSLLGNCRHSACLFT
eukprot:4808370-Pleurochrysis_carterae.AAC.2